MTEATYGDLVGDASVAYGHIDVNVLAAGSADCLTAAGSLEDALDAYIAANTKWNDCITHYLTCDANSPELEKRLQRQWTKAGASLVEARTTLDQLNPSSGAGPGTSS